MATSMDNAQNQPNPESQSFLGKAASEAADFGEGLYHGAIESPINGAVQLTNHLTGGQLPELHLVDEDRLSHSAGGVLGNIAGTALDVYALSAATAGVGGALGGSALLSSALRFGAVGAAYTAALQPTDAKSEHFIQDRLTNGAIALGTFATMGGAGALLDGTGLFAVSAARSLTGNLAYGGMIGAAGGIAHAETSAVLKDGRAVPTLASLTSDVGSYAAFGMAYGGANYAFNRLTAPTPQTFTTDRATATVSFDKQGSPVKVNGELPALGSLARIGFQATKMTDGQWSSNAWEQWDNMKGDAAANPGISGVQIDGNKLTLTGEEVKREFNADNHYVRTDLQEEAAQAQRKAQQDAEYAKYNKAEVKDGITTNSNYDRQMRVQELTTEAVGKPGEVLGKASIYYANDGSLSQVTIDQAGQSPVRLTQNDSGDWYYTKDNQVYKFDGDIKVLPKTSPGSSEQVQFIPRNGEPVTADLTGRGQALSDVIEAHSAYLPGGTGRIALSVDASGKTTLTGGSNHYEGLSVNGESVKAGQTVEIKAGDKIQLKSDIGDRYAIFETRELIWSRNLDGQLVLGETELKPNTHLDFQTTERGTRVVAKTT